MHLQNVPSRYRIRVDLRSDLSEAKDECQARLEETRTIFLLDIASSLVADNSEQASNVVENKKRIRDKEIRKKFSIAKPNRDFSNTTIVQATKDGSSGILAKSINNVAIDAYNYDRIITYIDLGLIDPFSRKESRLVSLSTYETKISHHEQTKKEEPRRIKMSEPNTKTPKKLEWLESLDFMKSASTIERLVSRNTFSDLQLMYYERSYSPKPVDDFQYKPQLLWICSCPRTYAKVVTSISWSNSNPEIFLVSYGKYSFETKIENGLVCIWNVKNAEFPERMSVLPSPVTFVESSKKYPRIAGVSFWDGTVSLLDVVLREPESLVKCHDKIGSLQPIWQIRWFELDGDEILLTCGQNGEIHTFKLNREFESRKLFTVGRVGNTVNKGIEMSQGHDRCCFKPAILFIVQYPKDEKVIFAGTHEGYVHIFSLYRPDSPLDVFGAHAGPITTIQFNPVQVEIFLTAGRDSHIRIWGYNIYETFLLELKHQILSGVDYAAWSPVHPYIIVSLSGCNLDVWNIKENISEPVTSIANPQANRNLVISFNPTGANFLVGDINGFVYIYSFTSIPKPPADPSRKLVRAILHCLSYDEEKLKLMILKLGPPFVPDNEKVKQLFFDEKTT